jgi:hypothetical protein
MLDYIAGKEREKRGRKGGQVGDIRQSISNDYLAWLTPAGVFYLCCMYKQ